MLSRPDWSGYLEAADFTSRAFSAARQTIIPVRQGNRLKLLPDLPALMVGSTLRLHIDSK